MLNEILNNLITKHFATLVLIIVYAIKLREQRKSKDAEMRFFWMTLICCFLLVMQDVAESITSMNPELRLFRIIFSIMGYALRPVAAVGLLLVVLPPEKRSWIIWIPCLVNLAVFLTAFFSPIAFSFDQDYHFTRGPLGYCVFIVAFFYMFLVLYWTWRRFYAGKSAQQLILIICAASCIIGAVIDSFHGGCRLNEAIMISSVFFYIFLRSHDNRLDPLTALGNRFAFYEDIESRDRSISAVASLDMNGMKRINDTFGHAEGDRALTEIGRCLNQLSGRNMISYRIGGDEFVILFLQQDEEAVQKIVRQTQEDVGKTGFSVSIGYAMRTAGQGVEQVLQESDHVMYRAKAAYYQQKGIDRRRR